MNRIPSVISLFLFFLCVNVGFGQYWEQTVEVQVGFFKAEESVLLFGDKVRLRSAASTDSEILNTLSIGDSVKIIQKTNQTLAYQGREYTWYMVKHQDTEGYIADAFFARLKINHKGLDYYVRHHFDTTKGRGSLFTLRMQKGNQLLDEVRFVPLSLSLRVGVIDDILLENLDRAFVVQYMGESCGAENGLSWVFINDNKLYHVADLTSSGDGGYHETENFIFRNTSQASLQPNQIEYVQSEGSEEGPEGKYYYKTVKYERILTWDGKKISPKPFKVK